MEQTYVLAILATLFGFAALAVMLLLPVGRLLKREQAKGEAWNEELRSGGQGPE